MDALPPSLPNAGLTQPVPAGQAGLAILLAELSEALAQTLAKLPATVSLTALVTQVTPILSADPGAPQSPSALLVQVSTPDGPAQIRLPPQVPVLPGAKLDILVSQAGPQAQWRLLAIDDRPAARASAQPAAAALPAIQTAPRSPPPSGIPATLVTSSDPALPSGTTVVVRITGFTPPPAAAAPAAAPELELAPEPEAAPLEQDLRPAPSPPPAVTAEPPAPAPAAVPGPAPMPAPSISNAPAAPAPASAPPPAEISGEVLANTDAGKPLVRTPIGLLALDAPPQTLPPEAKVTLQLVGKPLPPPAFTAPLPPLDDQPERALPRHVAELLDAAQRAEDPPLAEAVRDKVPAAGPRLAAQILSVLASAAQPQGLVRFLGDGLASALAHAAPQALDGLARHWEAASAPVQGPGDGDWRSLMIPFLMGGEVSTLRLTCRRRQGRMTAAEREKGTRFLLDLDLSRLGPMQFDGLVKRQHKRFDLIVRTTKPLPGEMRRDIDALFLNGLTNFGLEGSISFKPEGRFVTTPRLTRQANGIIFA